MTLKALQLTAPSLHRLGIVDEGFDSQVIGRQRIAIVCAAVERTAAAFVVGENRKSLVPESLGDFSKHRYLKAECHVQLTGE